VASDAWLVVGLGNPGSEYMETRHNIGFWVIDRVAQLTNVVGFQRRFEGEFATVRTDRGLLLLLKPLTFMNRSGVAVAAAVRWYKLSLDRTLVVHDDMDLPLGTLRFRQGGSAAGHHGVESVTRELGSNGFGRLRIGIGRPTRREEGRDFVLSPFHPEERPLAERIAALAAEAVLVWHREGMTVAMNRSTDSVCLLMRVRCLADRASQARLRIGRRAWTDRCMRECIVAALRHRAWPRLITGTYSRKATE
jgi:PTH1 family peptidyl-tRNA hydrolase